MERFQSSELDADFLGLVYDTSTDRWPDELLARLRERLEADCLHLLDCAVLDASLLGSQFAVRSPELGAVHHEYTAAWCATDPLVLQLVRCGDAGILRFPWPGAAPRPEDGCGAFLASHGLVWSMGGVFHANPGRATLLIARRSASAGPFGSDRAELLRTLLSHFRRAAELRGKTQSRIAAAEHAASILRQIPVGYVLTDRLGRCVEANDAFLAGAQRLGMRLVMGRFRFARREYHAAWDQALHDLHATGVERTVRLPGGGTATSAITLKPWRPIGGRETSPDQRLILGVLLEGLRTPEQHQEPLSPKVRLTRAELEVLAAMVTGLPAKSIANRRGASVNTVRGQIAAILEKMGFHSQRELIASFSVSGFQESGISISIAPPSFSYQESEKSS